MFEDSLFATNARPAPQRGLAAVLSFGIQAVMLAVLVLVPLIYTDALPLGNLKSWVEIPLPPGPRTAPPPQEHRPVAQQHSSNMQGAILLAPPSVPDHIADINESAAPPAVGPYVPGSTGGGGNASSLFNQVLASNMRAAPPEPLHTPAVRVVRVSRMDEGLLVHKVTPVYPFLAKQTHTQGSVVMQATIGRDGSIQGLQAISGHPLLVNAALEAVRQWRYRPYILNGEPVEVETQITVNFVLGS